MDEENNNTNIDNENILIDKKSGMTTVKVSRIVKEYLDSLKIVKRESFDDMFKRVYQLNKK